ncbi:MAG: bis(5'-nucleosyl)-tetraphosphatase (symmetrical) YqeK [Solobacterium sp.]|jgi:nicotinate-nucleotide adenylyltransferase|nr:bis(5'-nucleosyl)-tetraphosphatase (symmetrical) YqeK [Solobacterium sp.]MCH4205911.1 bis(5'-nucleosyl)-tetraphosphatase (symmetrical) YqeK [Solobacterium sp.]MCH4226256.1 bis(5'-nucleosyl)-tetraphosphatase (symmetrical) YqeK [Solobacterium sp.]MCH4282699.1 bis(5'-nucleosyl)-tetraphosphatase (symmetrical) YqeK [Solobacterium sp.]
MIAVEASFDPITESEIAACLQMHRSHSQEIFLQLKVNDAVLDLKERTALVKLAIRPYRHLHLLSGYKGRCTDLSAYEAEEKKVREGYFRAAAYGTRKRIFAKGSYFKETAHAMCSAHRYEHSIRVAETAALIAKHQNADVQKAYCAGLLHDIAKSMSHEEGAKILSFYRPEWLAYSDKIWHSFTAVILMKQNMAFTDEKILRAIEHHTLGDSHEKLAMILYLADKIEPGRGYDTSKHIALACHDLEACCRLVHQESEIYRRNREEIHE